MHPPENLWYLEAGFQADPVELVLLILLVQHVHQRGRELKLLRDSPLKHSPALPLGAVDVDDLIKLESSRGLLSHGQALGHGSENGGCPQPVPAIEVDDTAVSAADASSSVVFLELIKNLLNCCVDAVCFDNLHAHVHTSVHWGGM